MYKKQLDEYLGNHGFKALNLKAVLFDMDGVLFDSMPRHAKSWAKVCRKFGLNITDEEPYMHEGRTGDGRHTGCVYWKGDRRKRPGIIIRRRAPVFRAAEGR